MINRELIRIKEIQTVYSFCLNEGMTMDGAEKELLKSLSLAYDLYHYMLLLMVELNRMAEKTLDIKEARAKRLNEDVSLNSKFVNNRFILQLSSNKQLLEFSEVVRFHWADYPEFLRLLFARIEESETYKTYMENPTRSYQEDRELWRKIYREFVCNNEDLDSFLEEFNVYWNDDKTIVDTFVLKTINRFQETSTADEPLMPEYKDLNDREYAIKLLHHTLANASYYRSLIAGTTRRWELDRIALIDRVVLMVALAEIITFPSIPVSVSINEYVELAKMYGTPQSPRYVNATLDTIAKKLLAENKLIKTNNK